MENVDFVVPSRQRLVVGKLDGVVLAVTLKTLLDNQSPVFPDRRWEPADVVLEHLELGSSLRYPDGQLLGATGAQHHSARVESAGVEKPWNFKSVSCGKSAEALTIQSRIFPEDRPMIRRERLGSADVRLDTNLLYNRRQLFRVVQVSLKDRIIQVVQTKTEILLHVLHQDGIVLVATQLQRFTLHPIVDRPVVVPYVGGVFHAGDAFGDYVGVLEDRQRKLQSDHLSDIARPRPARVDHAAGLDYPVRGLHPLDFPHRRGGVRYYAGYGAVFHNLQMETSRKGINVSLEVARRREER